MTKDLNAQYLLSLKPSEILYLSKVQNKTAKWMPQSKPQWQAFFSRADEVFYGGSAGGGKACYTGTMIPTPIGWTTMQDIRVGDFLLDDAGKPCKVIATSETFYNHKCYEVVFDDGEMIIADASHNWFTYTASDRTAMQRRTDLFRSNRREKRTKTGTGKRPDLALRNSNNKSPLSSSPIGSVKTTQEIYNTLMVRGRTNHSIPVCKPLQLTESRLIVPPYTLGVWLGDGKTIQGKIYCHPDDNAIIDIVRRDGYDVTKVQSEEIAWTIRGLQPSLREIGVLGNKHIPMIYLRASYEQRLELLRGLMDTDGHCDKDGGAEYTSILSVLAKNVLELARTLGIKATMIEGRATLYGKDCGAKYRVKMTTDLRIFNLKRKYEKQSSEVRLTQTQRYIVDCRPVESVPVKCIEIDTPSHLYLAGNAMIPTHNSDLLLGLAGEAHMRSIIFRRVFPNLRFLVERSRQIYNPENNSHLKDTFNEGLHIWRLSNEAMIEFGAMQYEKDKSNFQGRPHDFIGIDEAPEFTESQFLFVTAWNRTVDPGQRVRVILTGNPPLDESGAWITRRYAAWLDKTHPHPAAPCELRWYAVVDGKETEIKDGEVFEHNGEIIAPRSRTFIPARLSDNIYLAEDGRYKSVLQSLPEPLRSQLLNGNFDASRVPNPFQIIPTEWVRLAQKRWLETKKPSVDLTATGIDPSRGGADKTSISRRYDNWFDEVKSWDGVFVKDGAIMAELARQEIGRQKPLYINIDVSGIGSSGYDHLKVMYDNVLPFNPAEGSEYRDRSGKLKMTNKRAEMYWRMRDALDPINGDELCLPPSTELLADLCSASYEVTSAGVKVEGKEQIKSRIGRSPDIGEAVMMCNFIPNSGRMVGAWGRRKA